MKLWLILLLYLVIISVIAVVITLYDKAIAGSGKRRIPENTLLLISALGGSVAMLITMYLIRHKTKHAKFMIGIPVIIVLQMALMFVVYKFFLN